MGAPVGDWHETSTQVDLLFPRVEQSDGSARTGLTITDFAVNLWDQADNNDYTKAAGAGAPGAPTIAVTVNEVAEGLYEWSFTPDAAGQFKLLVEYPTDGYVAQASVEATAVPGYFDKLNVAGTLAHSGAAATYKANVASLALEATLATVDGLVDAIKAKTDLIGASVAPDIYVVHIGVASTGTEWFFRCHLEQNGQVVTSGCTAGTLDLYDIDGAQVGSQQTDAVPDSNHQFQFSITAGVNANSAYYVDAKITYDGNPYTSRLALGTLGAA